MKLIHCADIHLGSKMESKLTKEKADVRKAEVRNAFSRMVEYARDNGICHILLAGDIFDSERPFKKDKEFFYSVVRANPGITFYYLRGNHDISASYEEGDLANLLTFGSEWTRYDAGDFTVSGIELNPHNIKSAPSTLQLDPARVNLVMLHGDISEGERSGHINIIKYRNKGIDYLALGHIHTYAAHPLDARGFYAYAGCLEGRGYDEMGVKGFVELDITDGGVTATFRPHAKRTILEYTVDISGAPDTYAAAERVRAQIPADRDNLVRVYLTGEVSFDPAELEEDVKERLSDLFYDISPKNKTTPHLDLSCDDEDISLRAEFIRTVRNNDTYTEDEKREILSLGLKALAGREI